jgi:hypothetical protein
MKERVIIAGGRDFNNYELLEEEVCEYLLGYNVFFDGNDDHVEFVLGGAKGADSLGERFADEYGFNKKLFIPNWKRPDGKTDRGAGIKRNHEMGNYANHLIAFWDGKSRGTQDMITYSFNKGLSVKIVKYEAVAINETSFYCRRA